MKNLAFILALVMVVTQLNPQTAPALSRDSIEVEGKYRTFEYFIPQDVKTASSLIFVLHGSEGTVTGTRWFTNYEFEKIATERKNCIIVYPEGYEKHWNDCRQDASYKANTEDINDVAFFSDMIDYFAQGFEIDAKAVFATGISNGGHMCYKLAYEVPNKIKGIASFGANIPQKTTNDCVQTDIAISVMMINGTADPINPYEGGWVVIRQDSTRGEVSSTEATLNYWKDLLPCPSEFELVEYPDTNPNENSTVTHYKYFCKDSKIRVELIKVINGGHTIPLINAPYLPSEWRKALGNTNKDVDAPLLVLDFFESLK